MATADQQQPAGETTTTESEKYGLKLMLFIGFISVICSMAMFHFNIVVPPALSTTDFIMIMSVGCSYSLCMMASLCVRISMNTNLYSDGNEVPEKGDLLSDILTLVGSVMSSCMFCLASLHPFKLPKNLQESNLDVVTSYAIVSGVFAAVSGIIAVGFWVVIYQEHYSKQGGGQVCGVEDDEIEQLDV